MIEIYLDGNRVYHDASQQIKFTIENPYITKSGSYTLEVSFPLSIVENRKFFGPIDRVDVAKMPKHYEARMLHENKEFFYGTAILSSVTNENVKLQLLGGNSEINFLQKYESTFVDEIDFEHINTSRIANDVGAGTEQSQIGVSRLWTKIESYDSTNGIYLNNLSIGDVGDMEFENSVSPGFLFTLHAVIEGLGFVVSEDEYLTTPVTRLYVLSGAVANDDWTIASVLNKTLPHWSFQEFITEVQNLLNATVYFDERNKTAKIIRNDTAIRSECTIDVLDEHSEEIDEEKDENTISTKNLKYTVEGPDMSGIGLMDEKIHDLFEHKLFANRTELQNYIASHGSEAEKYILCCPEGTAVYDNEVNELRFVDIWGMKYRGFKEVFEFKIGPAITKYQETESGVPWTGPIVKGPEALVAGENVMVKNLIYAYEEDYSSTVKKEDAKSDEMLLSPEINGYDLTYRFMMSLHTSGSTYYPNFPWPFTIGDLHKNPIKIKDKVLCKFEFLSKTIPDINKFFLIRNKKYIPKKIEFSLSDEGIRENMTGYFYELL